MLIENKDTLERKSPHNFVSLQAFAFLQCIINVFGKTIKYRDYFSISFFSDQLGKDASKIIDQGFNRIVKCCSNFFTLRVIQVFALERIHHKFSYCKGLIIIELCEESDYVV